jgi:hypothetical protein
MLADGTLGRYVTLQVAGRASGAPAANPTQPTEE